MPKYIFCKVQVEKASVKSMTELVLIELSSHLKQKKWKKLQKS